MGFDQITAGKYSMWIVAGMCVITAVVVALGLQKGTPTEEQKKIPYLQQIKAGLAEGRKPRIQLVYASAFVARADLVIIGTFLVLWGTMAGKDMGMTTAEAQSAARLVFVTSSMSALVSSPIIGYLIDKVDRIKAVSFCMAIAAAGYLSMFFVDNVLSPDVKPLFMLLGVGHQCAFFAATTLLGQEAPKMKRGAIVGVFNLAGAAGILISTGIGGRIYDAIGPHAPFVLIGFCNIAVSLFAIYVSRTSPAVKEA
jgi:MFS family permease